MNKSFPLPGPQQLLYNERVHDDHTGTRPPALSQHCLLSASTFQVRVGRVAGQRMKAENSGEDGQLN